MKGIRGNGSRQTRRYLQSYEARGVRCVMVAMLDKLDSKGFSWTCLPWRPSYSRTPYLMRYFTNDFLLHTIDSGDLHLVSYFRALTTLTSA